MNARKITHGDILSSNFYTASKEKGNTRILLPVRSKIALVRAAEKGGNPGSPTPPALS